MSWRNGRRPNVVFPLLFLLLFLPSGDLAAQRPPRPETDTGEREPSATNVIVRVRTVRGTPLMGGAIVRLMSRVGVFDQTTSTADGGEAVFTNVLVGNYIAEVSALGYLKAQEDILVHMAANNVTVVVNLVPEPEPGTRPGPNVIPVLAPKAQAEIDKALEAMRKDDLPEARKRLEKVQKMAPGHPDVYYLLGMLFLQMSDPAPAKANFEKATAIMPTHARALAALGDVYTRENNYPAAIRALEKSLEGDPDVWQTQGLLAQALHHEKLYERAKLHAARAVELSRGKSPEVQLLLAQCLLALGQKEQARPHLEAFLKEAPNDPSAAAVRKMLEPATLASPAPASLAPAAAAPPNIVVPRPEPPPRAWAPPDIDEVQPAVTQDVPCTLSEVVERASRRARTLVNSLERITATEVIDHAVVESSGNAQQEESREFNYVVTIRQYRKNMLSVDEDRFGRTSFYSFSSGMAATGLAAMALVFHPVYTPSYQMTCEGLGRWSGQPAWVVRFQQDPEKPNRFRTYRTSQGTFEVKLKGRAWVATNTGDVLHIETDLVEPVVPARLMRDHLVIDYAPVKFEKDKTQLWLPSKAELYSELKGKRYRIRHSFRDFMLFSVDVTQQVEELPDPPPEPPASTEKPPKKPPR